MYTEMENIDIYSNRFLIMRETNKKVCIKFFAVLFLVMLVSVIILFVKYPNIYIFEGYLNEDKIVVYLKENELDKLKGDTLKIENKMIKYNVDSFVKIDSKDNYGEYYLVTLIVGDIKLKDGMFKISIDDGTTNLYESFLKKIWKGF